MKFFVPLAKDDSQAAEVFEGIRKFAEQTTTWAVSNRRIFSIDYVHDGKTYHSEVGKVERDIGEEAYAILESVTYLVCTPNRGVLRGLPVLVGKDEAQRVTDFEA